MTNLQNSISIELTQIPLSRLPRKWTTQSMGDWLGEQQGVPKLLSEQHSGETILGS